MLHNENFKNIEWNKLLKGIRFTQGLTQEKLGEKLNLHRTQLLIYEQNRKPSLRAKNNILNYIQNNNLNIKEILKIYSKVDYLDKNRLWEKLINGIQTINGWSNKKTGKLLEVDKTVIESWKVNNLLPRVKAKSKILKLINGQNIGTLIRYSEINWEDLFNEIKDNLKISKTLLSKFLNTVFNPKNRSKKFIPHFKLRKEMLELKKSIGEEKDIRDIIFKIRKKKLIENKNLFLRYIRRKLGISQKKLANFIPQLTQTSYSRFELGYQPLPENKVNLIENKLEEISKKHELNFKILKKHFISKIRNLDTSELKQWKERKNIHKIIGFRLPHNKEEPYIDNITRILRKQNFTIFKNAILSDKNLNTFDVDIYAFKKFKHKKIELCFEVRDRSNRNSTSVTFLHNMNRLNLIRKIFNFDYSILVAPNISSERKRYSHNNIILLDNNDLIKLKNNNILDFLKDKTESFKILKINTLENFKEYLKQNKLTLRDISLVMNISFSCISKWRKDKELHPYKRKLNQLVYLVNTKGVAYIKFQRYKKIYTNKNFLKLKAIKKYLNLSENDFKIKFGIKPSELVDSCLNNKCSIDKGLLLKIKNYFGKKNYDWGNLLVYIKVYTNNQLEKWKQLEEHNKQVGWKFIKFLDNSNLKSKLFENKVSTFLSKKYKYILRNVQIYLNNTNQVREVDLISFNSAKDILITECKLKIPVYGSKILLNDLDTIKNAINAKYSWLVTQETNLNREFNQMFKK